MLIKDSNTGSSHWYRDTSETVHTVPNKSKPGTYRPTTIRDAKAMSLLPSVTSILSVIAKPQLVQWLCEQAILSALTLPRERGEIDDAFAERVVHDSKAQSRQAAEKGSFLHGLAEYYLTKGHVSIPDPEMRKLFDPIQRWVDENVESVVFAEKVLVNKEQGYAGTCDLYCKLKEIGLAICDFKGQKYRENKLGAFDPSFYSEFPLQLCAYRKCIEDQNVSLVSVPFCYEKPTPITHKVWPMMEQEAYWEAFKATHTLWKYLKKW
jgi:hypothetical protein